jgi:hypothetical protein
VHAHRGQVVGVPVELDQLGERLVVGRRTVEREVQRALGSLGVAEPVLEDPGDPMRWRGDPDLSRS